ncbi:hypothetical protein HLB23_06380 [Nocardia uniformis]|uniref:Uncharacterized protein n=1 Tax=Nocardia uniformis TaxID=53432 RepID=A0A849C0X6_9NOCA|nr:hypothetical protein [Nocardia uniformis]NNH69497.1 hypothetical protein [Nocardia uniformis]
MGSSLTNMLYGILLFVRWAGLIVISIAGIGILISEGIKSKLSPGKVLAVAGSAILAAVLVWVLPTLINYSRAEVGTVIPDMPVGGY